MFVLAAVHENNTSESTSLIESTVQSITQTAEPTSLADKHEPNIGMPDC
jgi:hypothetical protein